MSEARLLHFDQIPRVERGGGIYSTPLVMKDTGRRYSAVG